MSVSFLTLVLTESGSSWIILYIEKTSALSCHTEGSLEEWLPPFFSANIFVVHIDIAGGHKHKVRTSASTTSTFGFFFLMHLLSSLL